MPLAYLIPLYNVTSALVAGVFNSLMMAEGHPFFVYAFQYHFLGEWLIFVILTSVLYIVTINLSENKAMNLKLVTAYFKY